MPYPHPEEEEGVTTNKQTNMRFSKDQKTLNQPGELFSQKRQIEKIKVKEKLREDVRYCTGFSLL